MSGGGSLFLRAALLLGLFLLVASATGCSGFSSGSRLTLGSAGWDENVAVSNLTKALLEDELGYESVEVRTLDVADSFKAQSDMDAMSLEDLDRSDADMIFGIEPGAVIMQRIPEEVIPAYGLKQKLVESSTPGMLYELDTRYKNQEPLVFVAWSPYWMNRKYDFRYLKDPKGALGELAEPSKLSTIARKDLKDEDPAAYAFMKALALTEDQVNELEEKINETSDPLGGAREWAKDNRDLVQPWIEAARQVQNS